MKSALRRKLETFGPLPDRDVALVEDLGRQRRTVPAQSLLIAETEPASTAFLIHTGWAVRYRLLADGRRQIHGFILPGDIAAIYLSLYVPADHSVLTLTPATISPIAPERLLTLMREDSALGTALCWSLAQEMSILREHIVSIGRRSAYERTAYLILELWRRLDMVGLAEGNSFEFPLTQLVLADALGLSIVHINRTLRRLHEDGLIRHGARMITILNEAELAAVAEFDAARLRPPQPAALPTDAERSS